MAYKVMFLLKKCEKVLHLQKLLTFFFQQKYCDFDTVLTTTVTVLSTSLAKTFFAWRFILKGNILF